jgi:transposase
MMHNGVIMSQLRKKYSKEFKAEVVKLVLDGGRAVPEVSQQHGLRPSALYMWAKQARIDRGAGRPGELTSPEKEELGLLRRENRELRRERDFLQQAATYFAKVKQ